MKVRVGLLWHLHQPDYRDPTTGRPAMPWARLHALRGYRDLLLESVEQQAPMTINVVPSLWDQLLHYASGGDDRHLELTRLPAAALTPELAEEAVSTLPGGHHAMTDAWDAYRELKRRLAAGSPYSVQDLRDLQVWATLSWCGATAHRDYGVLAALARQGSGFSEDDKHLLLDVQSEILRSLPGLLEALAHADGPSLSTSPYYHPILPLLVDAAHARRSMPDLPDEVRFAWPEDARAQLVNARDRVRTLTGRPPQGLWPSEGSVSPEVVGLAGEAGFRWLVSDQGVLARSSRTESNRQGAWDLGAGVVGFFRNTELSDRIGFRYARWDPKEAVRDLMRSLAAAGEGVITVALDGENPWETFADAGGAFRRHLYEALRQGPVRGVTFDEAAAEPVVGTVEELHSGSWIGANFHIWIGHPADREAWRALAEAREAAEAAPPSAKAAALPHLWAAEGSDWTWWYGDDFHTEWEGAFDALFRAHLKAAWRAIGAEPPASLDRPIGHAGAPLGRPPVGFLDIAWTSAGAWLPWQPAGRLRAWGGSMAAGSAVRELRYGWTVDHAGVADALWVRVSVRGEAWQVRLPADRAEARHVDGQLIVRIPGDQPVELQFSGPEGLRWPPEPITLTPPEQASLAWWEL